jgi:hypothetical protein
MMKLDLGWIVLGRASMTPDGNRFGEGLDTFIMEHAIFFGLAVPPLTISFSRKHLDTKPESKTNSLEISNGAIGRSIPALC